jgi:hypothetical protein
LTFGRKKQPGNNDCEEAEDNEIVPFESVSNNGCGDLERLRCGMVDRHGRSPLFEWRRSGFGFECGRQWHPKGFPIDFRMLARRRRCRCLFASGDFGISAPGSFDQS